MTLFRLLTAFIFLYLFTGPALSAQSSKQEIAETILEKSGLEMQIKQIPDIVAAQYDHEIDDLQLREASLIRDILLEEFRSEYIYRDMMNYLLSNFDEERAGELITFFESELVSRMTAMEIRASEPSAAADMQSYLNTIESDPAARERINLMVEFDHSLDGTSFTVELLSQLYVDMIRALEPALTREQTLTSEQLEQYRADMYDNIYVPYRQVTVGFYLYAYRDVSIEDILRYKSFYDSSTGFWYNQLAKSMVRDAIGKARLRAAEKVDSLVNG
ncbi:MAG: hypothetical protein ACNA8K_01870 [Cyclonatronaceae bacterium]